MLIRIVLFALMALGLSGFGVVAWVSMRPTVVVEAVAAPPPEAPPPVVEKVNILVAARAIRAGGLLKPEEIQAREVRRDLVPAGAAEDSQAARHALVGAMVRRPMSPGEPLIATDMMKPGDHGFLAAVLSPGLRAVTIAVDVVSGTAGLIWPGDRVDLMVTQMIDNPSLPIGRRVFADTILRNARVIAIDQQMVQGAVPNGGEATVARTVTLEVTSEQAHAVQVASRVGRVSLSVRSSETPDGVEIVAANTAVFGSDILPALDHTPPPSSQTTIRVHSGTADSKEYRIK